MLFLVVTAALSGVNNWKHIELFGKAHLPWYRKYFAYANGIPSHDTLGRVFALIDNKAFNKLFTCWATSKNFVTNNQLISIDGKRLRGSYDKAGNKAAIHVVSAFASESGICIAQKRCDTKSNEITAIPEVLDQIAQKGLVISIDAMGCQKGIAKKIKEKEADYILAVKQNQDELHQQVKKMFTIYNPDSVDQSVDIGHGRIETRKCSVITNLKFMDGTQNWAGLKSIIRVDTERIVKLSGKTETNTRYYISSLNEKAEKFNYQIRMHWAIENNLHWVLDEVFNEDKSRRRKGNSPENFNIIAKIAMTLIKSKMKAKDSIAAIRAQAGWSDAFREKLLPV